jgi:hypothetical protein
MNVAEDHLHLEFERFPSRTTSTRPRSARVMHPPCAVASKPAQRIVHMTTSMHHHTSHLWKIRNCYIPFNAS